MQLLAEERGTEMPSRAASVPISLSACGSTEGHSRVPALKSKQIEFSLLLLLVRNGTYILVALKIPDGHCEDQEKSDIYVIFLGYRFIFQPAGF